MNSRRSGSQTSASRANRPPADLDDVDRRILEVLVDDGRLALSEVAARAHVSRATAYARFEKLRSSGVITGFRAVVDPERVGLGVTALILVNVAQNEWRATRDQLRTIPGVEYLALTSGSFDLVMVVRTADVHALRDVVLVQLHGMPHVRSTQTIFVLDEERYPVRAT